jgi:hypothetical protein
MGVIIIISAIVMEEIVDDIFSDPGQGDPETLIFDTAVLKKTSKCKRHILKSVNDRHHCPWIFDNSHDIKELLPTCSP